MKILVTGGAGYIGSHTVIELLRNNNEVVIVDNLSNSNESVIERIKTITKKEVSFFKTDILDENGLREVFEKHKIDLCIHFAGLKAVGESLKKPLQYYWNNVAGTLNLLKIMKSYSCKNIIFSSSATVYGEAKVFPISESCPKGECTNPYGWTKHMLEQILVDLYNSDNEWNVVILRYFNPLGAHESGLIGDSPKGIPNNLMPYITQVASGKLEMLGVFGDDYDTSDGTCIRDFVHVMDLATGHTKAIKKIEEKAGLCIYNLGTGKGYSILEMIESFEKANNIKVPYVIKPRRIGDVAVCFADVTKAEKELGWKAKYNLEEMCRDSWNWQKKIQTDMKGKAVKKRIISQGYDPLFIIIMKLQKRSVCSLLHLRLNLRLRVIAIRRIICITVTGLAVRRNRYIVTVFRLLIIEVVVKIIIIIIIQIVFHQNVFQKI